MFCNDFKEKFLSSGAIFAFGSKVFIGFGDLERSADPKPLSFFCPDFFLEESKPWLNFSHTTQVATSDFKFFLNSNLLIHAKDLGSRDHLISKINRRKFSSGDRASYKNQFKEIFQLIQAGDAQKIVSTAHTFSKETLSSVELLNCLKRAFESQDQSEFIYGFWNPDEPCFLGCSPEFLFESQLEDRILKTVSIAGTRSQKIYNNENSLIEDEKELHEQDLVTKGILKKLEGFGKIEVSKVKELHLKKLVHLKTDIQIKLNSQFTDFNSSTGIMERFCSLLHPTPSLGISSEILNWKILRKWRDHKCYKFFGTPFGIFTEDKFMCAAVAIRQIFWDERKVFIPVGCGIVKQSQFEKEWGELEIKTQSITDRFFDL